MHKQGKEKSNTYCNTLLTYLVLHAEGTNMYYPCRIGIRQEAGQHKVSKHKVEATNPQRLLLMYSLGDEMYKWVTVSGLP